MSYFLGSIVACPSADSATEIVDGQQRLATTAILLAAMRDHLLRLHDADAADMLERDYLVRTTGLRQRKPQPSLALGEIDNDFFLKAVLSRPDKRDRSLKATHPSHKRIIEASNLANLHVREVVGTRSAADQMAILDRWVEFIRDKAQVIFINVPDHADAFVIFETLNDRGLELSVADLTKNYLFGRSGTRVEEAKHHWNRMLGLLEQGSKDQEDVTKVFIHQLWSSLHGVTRSRDLFSQLRKRIYTEQAALDFAKALADHALTYAALRDAEHEHWNPFGPNAKEHIRVLAAHLRVTQVRTLLMAVLDEFTNDEVKKVLPYAVAWSVRFLIAGGSPGNLESYYASHASKVRKKEITTVDDLANSMLSVVPNNEKFKAAFASESVHHEYLARYYLVCLQRARDGEPNAHLAHDDETVRTLEHILPKNPDRAVWPIDDVTHEQLVDRIGNLAILGPHDNSNRGSDSYDNSKEYYRNSPFTLTQIAADYDKWDEKSIGARQAILAELAVNVWPVAVTTLAKGKSRGKAK